MTTPDRYVDQSAAGDDDPSAIDPARTDSRAELLPEEHEFDVQDPKALAAEVLRESEERTDDPDAGESGTGPTADPDPAGSI